MSINNITYLHDIIPSEMFIFTKNQIEVLDKFDWLEVRHFLNTLESNTFYVITFEFIPSMIMRDEHGPFLLLDKPIIITKNSNHYMISKYLRERIEIMIDTYYLDDSILQADASVIVKYSKINLF
jgi:hypothetical protein